MTLYVFLDESGNFDFSGNDGASQWYCLTSLATTDPEEGIQEYYALRHELYHDGQEEQHWFHATEDKQAIRDRFLPLVGALTSARVDCVAVEKRKLLPSLRESKISYQRCFDG